MNLSRSVCTVAHACLFSLAPPDAAATDTPAAAPAPKALPGCTAPEHRQFDFWMGDWVVRDPAGKVVGENHLTSVHKGCALFESWTGSGGFTGSSLSIYDAARRKWHQSWVDIGGSLLLLEGELVDGRMVLAGKSAPDAQGATALQRVTWSPLPDGRVRQHWESSADSGKTWTTVFDGYYAKTK